MAFNGQVIDEDGKVVNMKWQEFKWKAKQKYEAAKEWCKENKELVVAAVPALIGGAFEIIKIASKNIQKIHGDVTAAGCQIRLGLHIFSLSLEVSVRT